MKLLYLWITILKYLSINQRRYPFEVEYKIKIENRVRNLNFDKYNRIIISDNYEDIKYQIPLSIRIISEFDDLCKRINDLKTYKDFIALFEF